MRPPWFNFAILSKASLFRSLTVLYLTAVIAFIAWGRWDSVIYPMPLNPDEVQAAANVLRMFEFGVTWNAVDTTTVGPLNSIVLMWPYLLGGDVTLTTVRLTAMLLLAATLIFTYSSVNRICGKAFAAVLILPLALFYGLTRHPDYLHYSSELVSLCLLSASVFILLRLIEVRRSGMELPLMCVLLLGVMLGLAPFAKLQSAPIAVVITFFGFLVLGRWTGAARTRLLSAFVIGGVIPAVLFLGPLLFDGTFQHFVNSYIRWAGIYVREPLSVMQLHSLIAADPMMALLIYVSITLSVALLFLPLFFRSRLPNHDRLVGSLFLVTVGAVVFSVCRPGNMFPHYLMFLPPFMLMLAAFLICHTPGSVAGVAVIAIVFPFSLSMLSMGLKEGNLYRYESEFSSFAWEHRNLFQWIDPTGSDSLFIWGWMPQWYIWSGMTPASRETMTNNQIVETELRSYFRSRLLDDLHAAAPTFVIDSVAPGSFRFNDPVSQGLHSFPALDEFVSARYVRLGNTAHRTPTCPSYFARPERAAKLEKRLVSFVSLEATAEWSQRHSASRVDDFSVTEDACADYWLLPNGQLGDITVRFESNELVDKVLLLNTKNGQYLNHASESVEVVLKLGTKEVYVARLMLASHPEWTLLELERPVLADSLVVMIQSFKGQGGGLNEIKVMRVTAE